MFTGEYIPLNELNNKLFIRYGLVVDGETGVMDFGF